MIVKVTRDDIRDGTDNSPIGCAVARAIRRAVPAASYVSVSPTTVRVGSRNATLPRDVTKFINKFDSWPDWARRLDAVNWLLGLRPFEFELQLG